MLRLWLRYVMNTSQHTPSLHVCANCWNLLFCERKIVGVCRQFNMVQRSCINYSCLINLIFIIFCVKTVASGYHLEISYLSIYISYKISYLIFLFVCLVKVLHTFYIFLISICYMTEQETVKSREYSVGKVELIITVFIVALPTH